jgi:hypothetical protein
MADCPGLFGGIKMEARRIRQNPEQQVLEILDLAAQKKRTRSAHQKQRILKHKLSQVLLGQCSALKVHSKTLQMDLWFVNEGLADPFDAVYEGKVVTMEMLARMLSDTVHLEQEIRRLVVGG